MQDLRIYKFIFWTLTWNVNGVGKPTKGDIFRDMRLQHLFVLMSTFTYKEYYGKSIAQNTELCYYN